MSTTCDEPYTRDVADVETDLEKEQLYKALGRLIAAAPDMVHFLEALTAADVPGTEPVWAWQNNARALLAKIKGDHDEG